MSEPAPPTQIAQGERFGRFVLQECIGRGGMAEVFRAVAQGVEGFARVFVVKRLLSGQSANPALVEMFVNEARISALLNHPNIVQVYDFGQIEGSYFIAMEYVRGTDLLSLLRALRSQDEVLDPELAAYIAREVASGLAYAHSLTAQGGKSLNLVHRDVSPSNVMLMRAGGVKLLDFGIAKVSALQGWDPAAHTTGTGQVKGKLSYLSPEQVRNDPLDARSDIFSLGVVLWESLTGKRLFYDKADFHTMNNVLKRPIPPPSEMRADIPEALDAIALRCLERAPEDRYRSAKALGRDLDRFLGERRFQPNRLPAVLEKMLGPEPTEVETMPASDGPPDYSETPVMTPVVLGSGSFPNGVVAARSSDGLIPAAPLAISALGRPAGRHWPFMIAAGAALVVVAFSAGMLARTGPRDANLPAVAGGALPREMAEGARRGEMAPAPNAASGPSAAAPGARAATVSVRIETEPAGVEVSVAEGEVLGTTPLATTLPHSDRALTLSLRRRGYRPATHTITPNRDLTALVSLRPYSRPRRTPAEAEVAEETAPGDEALPTADSDDPATMADDEHPEQGAGAAMAPPTSSVDGQREPESQVASPPPRPESAEPPLPTESSP